MLLLADTQTVYVTQYGVGLGGAMAIVLSWQRNKSIVLAAIAGILSWIYVIYFAVTRHPDEMK